MTEDNQAGLWDRTVESPELEQAIMDIIDTRKASIKNGRAKKKRQILLKEFKLGDGERLRVGNYVIMGKSKSGGGFDIDKWSGVGVGSITELE